MHFCFFFAPSPSFYGFESFIFWTLPDSFYLISFLIIIAISVTNSGNSFYLMGGCDNPTIKLRVDLLCSMRNEGADREITMIWKDLTLIWCVSFDFHPNGPQCFLPCSSILVKPSWWSSKSGNSQVNLFLSRPVAPTPFHFPCRGTLFTSALAPAAARTFSILSNLFPSSFLPGQSWPFLQTSPLLMESQLKDQHPAQWLSSLSRLK